jgi:hypothetical protein
VRVVLNGYSSRGGEFPMRGRVVAAEIRERVDLTSCWPIEDPFPRHDLGSSFTIEVERDGQISAVRLRPPDDYPAFNRCAIQRLESLGRLNGVGVAGRTNLDFTFYEVH